MLRRVFVLLWLCALSLPSFAVLPQVENWCRDNTLGNMCGSKDTRSAAYKAWLDSPGVRSACGSQTAIPNAPPPANVVVVSETASYLALNFWTTDCWGGGQYYNSGGGTQGYFYKMGMSCPANSVSVSGGCECTSGFIESGGQCVDPNQACQAKSGTSSIVNVTAGWQRTPSVASGADWLYPTKLSSSGTGSACNGGCMQNFDVNEPCADCGSYVSQVPNSQGLYRVSVDFMGHYSGSACSDSPSDQVIKPDDSKDPPCPGFVGEVNGVKGCYGTADKPVRPSAPDPNLDKNGKDQGNPAAGTKPTSGSGSGSGGSGRTPGSGTGGSAGGPAGAAAGSATKPDGTKPTEEGKEQQNCGAPGQPKCGIDESGTPKTYTGSDGLADWKAAVDSNRAQIKDSGGGVFDGFAVFFSAPPVAACSAFALPNDYGSLDPCPVVDGVRGVMGYIWALGALFLCIGWIREAI